MTIFKQPSTFSLAERVNKRKRRRKREKTREKMKHALRIARDIWEGEGLALTADANTAIGIMAAEIFREMP